MYFQCFTTAGILSSYIWMDETDIHKYCYTIDLMPLCYHMGSMDDNGGHYLGRHIS